MDRPKHLDFKIVKKRALELWSKATHSDILVFSIILYLEFLNRKVLEYRRNWIMCTPLFTQ